MIGLLGATGKVGGAAAAALRRRGLQVRAVARDVKKGEPLRALGCEVVAADLFDTQAVTRALAGAEAVLAICPLRETAEELQADAQRLIDAIGGAAEAAAPRVLVAISDYGAQHAEGTGLTTIFHRLEQRLRTLPCSVTFLRSAEHMQNWLRQTEAVQRRGVLASLHHPLSKPFPTVSALDVGAAAAELLACTDVHPGAPRLVHIEGPRRYCALEVAEHLGRLLGRPVTAQALPRERWERALTSGGQSASYARLVTGLQDAHNAGRIDFEAGVGEVWRGETDLAEALRLGLGGSPRLDTNGDEDVQTRPREHLDPACGSGT